MLVDQTFHCLDFHLVFKPQQGLHALPLAGVEPIDALLLVTVKPHGHRLPRNTVYLGN